MSDAPVSAERYSEDYYAEACGGSEFFARYGTKVLKPVLAHALRRAEIREGMTALDVGCGRGELLAQLKERGAFATGCDYADAAAKIAAQVSGCPVLLCDAKKLPFADRSFDRIFFLGVIDHLRDWELEACFAEFRRTLKEGGFVLVSTCANTDYYKNKTYGARRAVAAALGLKQPRPPRSEHDEHMHVNEHNESGLEGLFARLGWRGEIELRPNPKYDLEALYGGERPKDLPLKSPAPWKRAWHGLTFRGPWKRLLARELFCRMAPV